jgi:hypothetical protein
MGQHVMGLTPASDVHRVAGNPERRCEMAYYVGVRALAEGRSHDAADWFLAALATGQTRDGELIWAQQQLAKWANQGKSLRLLTAGQ